MKTLPLCILVAITAASAHAQCPNLDLRFRTSPLAAGANALIAYDAGVGEHLFAAVAGVGVHEWDGMRWSVVPGSPTAALSALAVHDFGGGPELVVGGSFVSAGGVPANRIARWNGSTWSAIGSGLGGGPGDIVRALAAFDVSGTTRLVATGVFTSSGATALAHVAMFDGAAWQPLGAGVGAGLGAGGRALAVADTGSGPTLFVGGDFTSAGAQPCARIASWNGSAWTPLATGTNAAVHALLATGTPGSQQLIAGGLFTTAGAATTNYVARWDGTAWNALGFGLDPTTGLTGSVLALLPDGAGFLAAGVFSVPSASSPNVARFDGTSWQAFGGGLGNAAFSGLRALARFDPADGGGARVFASGPFSARVGEPRGIAQSSGASWNSLRDDGAQGLLHQSNEGGALSATIWQGDLVIAGAFDGAGSATNARSVARWDGVTWHALGDVGPTTSSDHGSVVSVLDIGSGPELLLGMQRYWTHDASVPVYRWNGSSWTPLVVGTLPSQTSTGVLTLEQFDDGSGPMLYAAGQALRTDANAVPDVILRWDGTAWSRLTNGPALTGYISALAVFDDGTGSALYAAGTIPGGIQRWNGTSWNPVGAGFTTQAGQVQVSALHVFDHGQGPRLHAGGAFMASGAVPVVGLARWNGASWEQLPPLPPGANSMMSDLDSLDLGSGPQLLGLTSTDEMFALAGNTWTRLVDTDPYFTIPHIFASEDMPGGAGVLVHGNFRDIAAPGGALVEQAGLTIFRACPRIESFCTGDGLDADLAVACPCANTGAVGHGCAWNTVGSGPNGARLTHQGSPHSNDLVLLGESMPTSGSSLFFQGATSNHAGAVFGDGLRCAAGAVVRLRTRMNVNGAAQVPVASEPSLASIGGVVLGSGATRAYQVWFRVAANFCTSATFNLSNALSVRW